MILYRIARDNGAVEPWLQENEWMFQIHVELRSWLIGADYYYGVTSVHVGPLKFTYGKFK